MANLLYGLAQLGLGLGQGYYGGLAERNRMQYEMGRQREADARQREMFEWQRQQQAQNRQMFEWQRGNQAWTEQERQRRTAEDAERTALMRQIAGMLQQGGGGPEQPAPLPAAFQEFSSRHGLDLRGVGGQETMGPTLPASGGQRAPNWAGIEQSVLGSNTGLGDKASILNMLTSIRQGREQDMTAGAAGLVQPGHLLENTPRKDLMAAMQIIQFGNQQQDRDERERILNMIGSDFGLTGVFADQPVWTWDVLIKGEQGQATILEAQATRGRLEDQQWWRDYNRNTARPVVDVQAQYGYDRNRLDWLAKETSAYPDIARFVPQTMQQAPLGVVGDVMGAGLNAVRGGVGLTPAGELPGGENLPLPLKSYPGAVVPDIAAIGKAGGEATQTTRTGDTPDAWVSRTVGTLYNMYIDPKFDKIPPTMLTKYKTMLKQALDEKRFKWTNEEISNAEAQLDKWALEFNEQKRIERVRKAEADQAYQRQVSLAGIRSGGSGGTGKDPNIELNRKLDIIDQLIKSGEGQLYDTVDGVRIKRTEGLPANAAQLEQDLQALYAQRQVVARQIIGLGGATGQGGGGAGAPKDTYVKYLTPPQPGDGRGWVAVGGVDIQKFYDFLQTQAGVPGPEVTALGRELLEEIKRQRPNMMIADAYRQIIRDMGIVYRVHAGVLEEYL